MENGAILDEQITASSQFNSDHAPFQGRLHFQETTSKAGSWTAGTEDHLQWLQVDLGSQYTKVTRVATQGRNDFAQWVTKYKLTYSDDGVSFHYYREQGQTADKVWLRFLSFYWGRLYFTQFIWCDDEKTHEDRSFKVPIRPTGFL